MTISIQDKLGDGACFNLKDLSYDLNIALESEFRDLIKSPNFQDLMGVEQEEHFYAMLFMRRAKELLKSRYKVPFISVDYFLSSTIGKKHGLYAPFYCKDNCFDRYFVFSLACEGLVLNIEIDYKFTAPYKDIYLRPLEECVSHFSNFIFKSKIKLVAYSQDEYNVPNANRHHVELVVNNRVMLLSQIMEKLKHISKYEFDFFKQNDPDWLIAKLKDSRQLHIILAKRKELISRVINNAVINPFDLKPSDINIRFSRITEDHINKEAIIYPFVVSIDNYISINCCMRLTSEKNRGDSSRYLYRRGLIKHWKSIADSIEFTVLIEGCGDYDPYTFLFGR